MRTLLPQPKTQHDPFLNLFDSFFLPEHFAAEVEPRTNIAETDQAYELSFELPGLDEKDIQVQVHDRQLTVTAERRAEQKSEGKTWHRVEHRYGKLSRTVLLPEAARSDAVDASYKQGVLNVTVQKSPERLPTKVQVKKG
jgi:HSP20 family protein